MKVCRASLIAVTGIAAIIVFSLNKKAVSQTRNQQEAVTTAIPDYITCEQRAQKFSLASNVTYTAEARAFLETRRPLPRPSSAVSARNAFPISPPAWMSEV